MTRTAVNRDPQLSPESLSAPPFECRELPQPSQSVESSAEYSPPPVSPTEYTVNPYEGGEQYRLLERAKSM